MIIDLWQTLLWVINAGASLLIAGCAIRYLLELVRGAALWLRCILAAMAVGAIANLATWPVEFGQVALNCGIGALMLWRLTRTPA